MRGDFVKIKKGWQSLINTQQLFAMIKREEKKEVEKYEIYDSFTLGVLFLVFLVKKQALGWG